MASASNPQSLFNVFVYGSLLADDVVIALLKRVLSGITIPELDILDKFEDVEYERRTVDVSLTDSSDTLMVEAYIWADQSDPNLFGEWDFEEWERLHKLSFMKMTMEFLEELEQPNQSGSI